MNSRIWLRWAGLGLLLLLAILVPFFLYEAEITRWTEAFIAGEQSRWTAGGVLAGLLASDVLLPVPSSLVSTAAGYLLGLWSGALVSWAGMTAGCLVGYALGSRPGRGVSRKFVGEDELDRVAKMERRYGDWVIILFRAAPVLAEASVVFAGVVRMPFRRFLALTSLSNLGIAVTYAAVGVHALKVESFLLAFAGAVGVPGVAMLLVRNLRDRGTR